MKKILSFRKKWSHYLWGVLKLKYGAIIQLLLKQLKIELKSEWWKCRKSKKREGGGIVEISDTVLLPCASPFPSQVKTITILL